MENTKKILVVDDEHMILKIINDILSKEGYEVYTATNYNNAIKILEENSFSVVLTDIRMPERSGIDLLSHIRQLNEEVSVILMTGFASLDSAMDAVKQGAFDYLTKPLDFSKLTKVIKQSIEKFELVQKNKLLMNQLQEMNLTLEQKVNERSRELKNILNSANEAIITTDTNLVINRSNPKTKEIFGSDYEGKKLDEIIDGVNFDTLLPKILNDSSYEAEQEVKYNDKYLEVKLSQYLDYETKEIFGIVAVVDDITDKKKLEAQLVQSAKMSAVGQLAAGISHEFNNVLSGIVGYTSLAMSRDNIEKVRQDLSVVDKASQRAIEIIKKLLTFSKQKEEKLVLTQIDEVIEDAISLIKNALDSHGIKIVKHFSKMPAIKLNQGEIQQVLLNLIINAQHAILQKDNGNNKVIGVTTTLEDDFIKIDVSDTGVGISKENLPRIFDPFFSTKDKKGDIPGSGLGLSVSYAIIERHNGNMDVSSNPGEGTTFTIKLPYVQPDTGKGNILTTNSSEDEDHSLSINSVRKLNILVIDDEAYVRNLISETLNDHGHNILSVDSGIEAASYINNAYFDLVFLDIMLPDVNGFDILKRIKLNHPGTMVVVITGSEIGSVTDKAIAEGASSFLHKPFTVFQIRDTVSSILGVYN